MLAYIYKGISFKLSLVISLLNSTVYRLNDLVSFKVIVVRDSNVLCAHFHVNFMFRSGCY